MSTDNIYTSIIIPTWNGKNFLHNCLNSLKRLKGSKYEVIIVDNGSTDGTAEMIGNCFANVMFIPNNSNMGFSKAVNIGIKISHGHYVALLNNDTIVDENWIENGIASFKKHLDVSIIASKIIDMENKYVDFGDEINIVGQAKSRRVSPTNPIQDKPCYVFSACAGGAFYKRDVFEKVGFFEEDFVMYFEDLDLSYRCQCSGLKIWYEPTSIIHHVGRGTSSRRPDELEYQLYKNFIMSYLINTPTSLLFVRHSLVKFLLVCLNTVIYLSYNGYFIQAVNAWGYALTNVSKIAKLRNVRQNTKTDYRVSNQYIDAWRKKKVIKIINIKF